MPFGARAGSPPLSAPAAGVALERLFAYGTLMTGFSRRPLLGAAATLEGRGRVRGSLHDFGDYPGIRLDGDGWVVGELYRVADLAGRLSALDRAEGYDPADESRSLYLRRCVAVLVADGPPPEAWIYVYNGPPGRGRRVESGDWRAHVAARGAPSR